MRAQRHAVFLDRDGVINREIGYLHRIEDFEFLPGAIDACSKFQSAGYLLIVITNQAGIARGFYSEADFEVLNDWMVEQFQRHGVHLDKVLYCPFHPEGLNQYRRDSYYRKPNPGLIFRAQKEYDIDLSASILVGDKETDIEAGLAAQIRTCVIVRSGAPFNEAETKAHLVVDSLADLANSLLASPELKGKD